MTQEIEIEQSYDYGAYGQLMIEIDDLNHLRADRSNTRFYRALSGLLAYYISHSMYSMFSCLYPDANPLDNETLEIPEIERYNSYVDTGFVANTRELSRRLHQDKRTLNNATALLSDTIGIIARWEEHTGVSQNDMRIPILVRRH